MTEKKDVNTIDFSKAIKEKVPAEWFKKGMRTFRKLTPEDQREIWDFITTYLLCTVRINNGLIQVDSEILMNDDNFEFANEVADIYTEATHGCFLCNPASDSNEKFDENTYVCFFCQTKIHSIVAHYILHFTDKDKPEWYKKLVQGRTMK